MKTIDDINFDGKRVVMRVDFNVPLNEKFEVSDQTRLKAAVPSIKKIIGDGGSVVLLSHLGRPKEGPEEKFSLKHLLPDLKSLLGVAPEFCGDCASDDCVSKAENLQKGQILLAENLRFYKEETKGDEDFAGKLARLGQVYVNDAFGTAHRAHASTAVIAKFFPNNSCFGYVMAKEIANAEKVMNSAEKPFTAIMGGAKVSDKLLIIERLLDRVDNLIIGGGMAFTFVKAAGGEIGDSICEEDKLDLAKKIVALAEEKNVALHLPTDAIIANKFDKDANSKPCEINKIESGWMGLDIGVRSAEKFAEVINNSRTILWNGPMGVFEFDKFASGTKTVAVAVANASSNGAFSLIGGGDSAAAVNKFGFADQVSYVSTGGGALLEYFEGKELPGVAMVMRN